MSNRKSLRHVIRVVVACSCVGLAGCGLGSDPTVTPTTAATPTPIPMLTVLTPTPGGGAPTDQTPPANPDATEVQNPEQGTAEGEGAGERQGEGTSTEPSANDGTYIVAAGDTLYAIAVRFNVTMEALSAANGITDPSSIQVGQVLVIP